MAIYNCPNCNSDVSAYGVAETLAKYVICPNCKTRINLDLSDEEYLNTLRAVLDYTNIPKRTYNLPTIEDDYS